MIERLSSTAVAAQSRGRACVHGGGAGRGESDPGIGSGNRIGESDRGIVARNKDAGNLKSAGCATPPDISHPIPFLLSSEPTISLLGGVGQLA
jgi:hypothetical protein